MLYLYGSVGLLASECTVHLCVSGWYQIRVLASGTKVQVLDMYGSIILSSKITHQMWHDHPFS